jgi:hypothetical protein
MFSASFLLEYEKKKKCVPFVIPDVYVKNVCNFLFWICG